MSSTPSALARLRGTVNVLYREMIKFGVVGAVAFVIDIGLFNLLRRVLQGRALRQAVISTKIISAAVATVVAWIGNRRGRSGTGATGPRPTRHCCSPLTNGVGPAHRRLCVGVTNNFLAGDTRGWPRTSPR